MTWLEFKEQVEKAGVKDSFVIDWIDISYPIPPLKIGIVEDSFTVCD